MATSKGEVYGFTTKDGTIYIDIEKMNANTPIHEFGHLYWNVMPAEMKAKITELMKQTKEWKRISDNPAYSHLKTEEQKADEVFNTILGNYGENSLQVREMVYYLSVSLTYLVEVSFYIDAGYSLYFVSHCNVNSAVGDVEFGSNGCP